MTRDEKIEAFLGGEVFAVIGASSDRAKYGNKVLRTYMQNDRDVHPVNPRGGEIEGQAAYASLAELPAVPHGISIITPPAVTERVMREAAELGVKHAWMQPGAESAEAIRIGEEAGMSVIGDGSCVLVVMGFREHG